MVANMPIIRTPQDVIRQHLASETPPAAIIFIDGQEFMIVPEGEAMGRKMMNEARETMVWNEISLMVYKPRHGGYIRASMISR